MKKDRKLLIPVRCTTRKFFLNHPPAGKNDWYVRFTSPAVEGVKRVIFRCTGTKEIAAAKRIGAQIIESFWNDAGRGAKILCTSARVSTSGRCAGRFALSTPSSQPMSCLSTSL